eukprot:5650343-Pyramimonas_sp.AAC.1
MRSAAPRQDDNVRGGGALQPGGAQDAPRVPGVGVATHFDEDGSQLQEVGREPARERLGVDGSAGDQLDRIDRAR